MIYTVTLNPSLDYYVTVKDFQTGRVNRTVAERITPGGKGLNVSQMLCSLGCESVALGFLAGFTGDEIERRVRELGVRTDFLRAGEGFSRINVKLWNDTAPEISGRESEINGMGPALGAADLEAFYEKLMQLEEGDTLVLAGSIPSGLPDTIYQDICGKMAERNVRMVVDASGELLRNVLPYKPFLVKPNHKELGELFGCEITTREEAIPYACELQKLGAVNVLVSLAGEGAVLISEDGAVYPVAAPEGIVRNSVGAGDSMVAGFLAGYEKNQNYEEAFKLALCAGSASAFSDGIADGEAVRKLSEQFEAQMTARRQNGFGE